MATAHDDAMFYEQLQNFIQGKGWRSSNAIKAEEQAAQAPNPMAAEMDKQYFELMKAMFGPIDPNSPEAQAFLGQVKSALGRDMRSRGLSGGISNANLQDAYMRTMGQLQQGHYGIGLQAGNALAGRMQDARNFQQGIYNSQRAANVAQGQGLGGLIGTAAGLLPALAGPAGLPFLQYTIPAGNALGSGLGGMAAAPLQYAPAGGMSSYTPGR